MREQRGEGRQRERVIAHGAKEFGRPVGSAVCEKTPTGGDGEKECEKRAAGGA